MPMLNHSDANQCMIVQAGGTKRRKTRTDVHSLEDSSANEANDKKVKKLRKPPVKKIIVVP